MNPRPSTFEIVANELIKIEKTVYANKPESLDDGAFLKYQREFREWKPEHFFLHYTDDFVKENRKRMERNEKINNPELKEKLLDPVVFTWDMVDRAWPFLKNVKGAGRDELSKSFKLITDVFSIVLK
jgi:hypothetical protein